RCSESFPRRTRPRPSPRRSAWPERSPHTAEGPDRRDDGPAPRPCGAPSHGRPVLSRSLDDALVLELAAGASLERVAVGPQLPELRVLDAERARIELRIQALLLPPAEEAGPGSAVRSAHAQLPELRVLDAERARIELRIQALLLLPAVVLQRLQRRHLQE